MSISLSQFITQNGLETHLISAMQTSGFVTAMAAAPNLINPNEWLAFMWGGEEDSPFTSPEQLEQYANIIVTMWNKQRVALLSTEWQWPEGCALSDIDIITEDTRHFCEGILQGWMLTRDDWETLMPEDSEDSALLGGVILSISLLFDPEAAMQTLDTQGAIELAQFEEIFNAIPAMLSGLTQRAVQLVELQ